MIVRQRRLVAAVAAVATAAAVATVAATTGPGPATAAPPTSAGTAWRTITLITGDRLAVDRADNVTITRAKGRERMPFSMSTVDGHLHVTPADALPLVRAGRLDPRLFDVTTLLASGYDDERRVDLPLIVAGRSATAGGAGVRAAARPVVPAGVTAVRDLPGNRGVAARADRANRAAVWNSIRASAGRADAPKVWLDGLRTVALDVSVPRIGAPAAWAAGFTGTGVRVAIVDSGIDATHPDLAGQVVAQRNFVEGSDERDLVGHGTHVAATVAGTGAGRYRGVAPGATLIAAKVCESFGCPESAIIEGMRWAVADEDADVVNMSLSGGDTPDVDPLEQAVADLTAEHGALFVIAAGNAGAERSVGSPGSADAALTVGAVDDTDALAGFSSRGPRIGDGALKPDITAPGVDIVAARGADAGMGRPGEQYVSSSGTSMAAPHVSGAAAILAQRRPDWDPARLKAALMASARANPAIGVFGQGAGRVDVPAALARTVTTSPASVSFGLQKWPHTDDERLTRTVSYRNDGAAAVTLSLSLAPYGTVPANLFTLNRGSVTVPPGGTADVAVTADTRIDSPDGFFGAAVVAAGPDGVVVRTPVAVEKEVESYDVTLVHTTRAGQPARYYSTALQGLDNPNGGFVHEADGTVVARVPKGRYFLFTFVVDGDVEDPAARIDETFLLQPVVTVDADKTVALDARTAKPVTVAAPRPDAVQFGGTLLCSVPYLGEGGGSFGFGVAVESFATLFAGAVGGDIRLPGLVTKFNGTWAKSTVDDSPYQYNLSWVERDRAVTGLTRSVRDRDLAKVETRYLGQIPGGTGAKAAASRVPGLTFGGAMAVPFRTPATRTEFYTADRDTTWATRFQESSADGTHAVFAGASGVGYVPRRTYRETWNKGVFGPGLPGGYDPANGAWAGRIGDEIVVDVPMFADGTGRAGYSTGTGTVTLYRDGVRLATVETVEPVVVTVPPGPARYRLEVEQDRGEPFTTTTRVTGVWEFSSDTTTGITPLDLSAVRFTPEVDDRTTAPAGRRFTVPVTVQKQLGSGGGRNRSLAVEVSYDDGGTWLPARIHRGSAVLDHPRGSGFVSLRARATDAGGNTTEQVVIRAYRYGR